MNGYERLTQRVIREILSMTYVPGNGGYAADFGPLCFGEMCNIVRAPQFRNMAELRAWASGEGWCGVLLAGGQGRLGCATHRCGKAPGHIDYHLCGNAMCGTSWGVGHE